MIATLNAKRYWARSLRRRKQAPLAAAFRTVGQQRYEDLQVASSVKFGAPVYGLGLRRIHNWDDPKQFLRFWSSSVETRFPTGVYLPLNQVDTTEATNTQEVRGSAEFKGALWALWEWNDGTNEGVVARTFSSGAWSGGGTVLSQAVSSIDVIALDLIAHKTHLIALVAQADDHLIRRSTDGVTWVAPTAGPTLNLLSTNVTADGDIYAGLLAQVRNEAIAVLWDEDSGTITFFSSSDAGANWADEAVDIPSGGGPQGVAVYPGLDGEDKLYVGTREGVWEVDVSPATWTTQLILPLPYDTYNCRRMTVHQGRVWVPVGVGTSEPAIIYTIEHRGDLRLIDTARGLDVDDGVPSEMLGRVHWMHSAGKFLYLAVGGVGTGRNARVLAHNGLGWHSVVRHDTATQSLKWIHVSSGILHFAVRTGSKAYDSKRVADVGTDPGSGITADYGTSGILQRPEIDGGMPRTPCAWLQYFADAASLSASTSGEYIGVKYGLEGASADTTTLGNALSGDKDLDLGSSLGVSGVSIQTEETLKRDAGSAADSPILRNTELVYLKRPAAKQAWELEIDIPGSAALEANVGQAAVIANLETVRDSVTLVTFSYEGMTSKNVIMEELEFLESVPPPSVTGGTIEVSRTIARVLLREVG